MLVVPGFLPAPVEKEREEEKAAAAHNAFRKFVLRSCNELQQPTYSMILITKDYDRGEGEFTVATRMLSRPAVFGEH